MTDLRRAIVALATTNPGKVREFRALAARCWNLPNLTLATPQELGFLMPPVDETGATFAENAQLKAIAVARATGHIAIADDSGLCVDALDGAPGLHSARWAGPDASDSERTARLMELLEGVASEGRTARFVCAAALASPDGRVTVAKGVCEGAITASPRGANGFGYDPIFLIPYLGRTLAELADSEKNELSHRAQAIAQLSPALAQFIFPNSR